MSKLFRRSCFALSIAAVLVLLVGAPAGAFAAGDEFSGGSGPGETVVEPSGDSTQPAAPASTEWSPQGSDGGASSGGAAPLQHGSSVGSGVVTGKAGSAGSGGEAPPYTPDSSGSYEPEPSTPPAVDESVSVPSAESGIQSAPPRATETATEDRPSRTLEAVVGDAISVGHAAQPQGGGASTAPPAAASFTGSGDGVSTGSYALPLLVIILLGLVLVLAGARLRRRRQRRRLDTLLCEQGAAWEAALRRAGLGQGSGASEPSAQRLQRVNVG